MSEKQIKEGQLWRLTYPDEIIGKETTFIVRKIEESSSNNDYIAHLSIYNIKHLGKEYDIDHLPIKLDLLKDALNDVILIKKSFDNVIEENNYFLEGYKYWKEAKGGAWNIPLIDAIKKSISHLNN